MGTKKKRGGGGMGKPDGIRKCDFFEKGFCLEIIILYSFFIFIFIFYFILFYF